MKAFDTVETGRRLDSIRDNLPQVTASLSFRLREVAEFGRRQDQLAGHVQRNQCQRHSGIDDLSSRGRIAVKMEFSDGTDASWLMPRAADADDPVHKGAEFGIAIQRTG